MTTFKNEKKLSFFEKTCDHFFKTLILQNLFLAVTI